MENHRPARRARPPSPVSLTETDLELLGFLAEHRFARVDHAAALLAVKPTTARRRLDKLTEGGYAEGAQVFSGQPPLYLITRAGLGAIGSRLPKPRLDLHTYEHDVGLAWLWIAARRGTFGPLSEALSERTLRSRDGRAIDSEHHAEPLGVRLGGRGPGGRERVHYPDLLLRTADGRRIAVELELSTKVRTRLETILAGYGADPRIDGVAYLVQSQSVARAVERAARRVGVSDLVHLQRVRSRPAPAAVARSRALERASEAVR